MNNIFKFFIFFLFLFPSLASAAFDFGGDGGGCDGGSGNFQQQIDYYGGADNENSVTVGVIPAGLIGVEIYLISNVDVDVRLYDDTNGKKIVHWPYGLLSGSTADVTTYNGVNVEYSGYNGDGTGLGNEYIKISGTTQQPFLMKAFGYAAGFAKVEYSWTGRINCDNATNGGQGTFNEAIVQNDTVLIGDIPPGIPNLVIKLISDKDVDIQLYDADDNTKIIQWPIGILSGSSFQSINYQGMHIEWSGYNGDGTGLGHEYIKIIGTTTRNLTMKAYGYTAGVARVDYEWGQ